MLSCHGLGVNSTETTASQEQVYQPLYSGDAFASAREEAIEAEKLARAAKRAAWEAEQKRASQLVIDYIVACGESEHIADEIVLDLRNRRTLLEVVPGPEVDAKLLNRILLKRKRAMFGEAFRKVFPFEMPESQKKEITSRILRAPSVELSKIDPTDIDLYISALESAIADNCDLFICPICYDPLIRITADRFLDSSKMWFAKMRKTEHWTNMPCDHAVCKDCMKGWVETTINDHKVDVKCPAPACSYNLWDYDIQNLVSTEVFERYQEHKHASYLSHLKDVIKEDALLKTWLCKHARPCPDCHVIVSRYEGCDIMQCVCGTKFMYCCGFKSCRCHKKGKKPDIWKPKA